MMSTGLLVAKMTKCPIAMYAMRKKRSASSDGRRALLGPLAGLAAGAPEAPADARVTKLGMRAERRAPLAAERAPAAPAKDARRELFAMARGAGAAAGTPARRPALRGAALDAASGTEAATAVAIARDLPVRLCAFVLQQLLLEAVSGGAADPWPEASQLELLSRACSPSA